MVIIVEVLTPGQPDCVGGFQESNVNATKTFFNLLHTKFFQPGVSLWMEIPKSNQDGIRVEELGEVSGCGFGFQKGAHFLLDSRKSGIGTSQWARDQGMIKCFHLTTKTLVGVVTLTHELIWGVTKHLVESFKSRDHIESCLDCKGDQIMRN